MYYNLFSILSSTLIINLSLFKANKSRIGDTPSSTISLLIKSSFYFIKNSFLSNKSKAILTSTIFLFQNTSFSFLKTSFLSNKSKAILYNLS